MQSLWMLLASLLFSLMAACAKWGAADFGVFELVFYRSGFGFLSLFIWILWQGRSVKTPLWGSHLKRSFLGTFALTIWFYALSHLPLGTGMTLNYTSPLYTALIVVLLAWRHRQKVQWGIVGAIVLGFFGVMQVLQPEIHAGQEMPALIGLSSGFLSALAYYQIKELSSMHEPEWRIVFYFTLFGTVWGLCGHLLEAGSMTPVTWENVPALIGMGATATGAQLAMTRAWGAGNLLLTSCLQFSAIIFAALFGLLFFGEPMTLQVAVGIVIILVAGIASTMLTKKRKPAATSKNKA